MPPQHPTTPIPKQIRLPLIRAVEIALKSLRMRRGKSLLTLLTIALGTAFLAFIWMTRIAEPVMAAAAARQIPSVAAGPTGAARTLWLVGLSLLVCLVGITNAMLMSVMERFREIGTMKCLGALDSFILKLFLIESLFLGLAGSITGSLAGAAMGWIQLSREFAATPGWAALPSGQAWTVILASALIGILITTTAAFYPAWRAARMDPIAAMRVEV